MRCCSPARARRGVLLALVRELLLEPHVLRLLDLRRDLDDLELRPHLVVLALEVILAAAASKRRRRRLGGGSRGVGGDTSGPGAEGGSRSGSDYGGGERSAEATPGREQRELINKVRAVVAPD